MQLKEKITLFYVESRDLGSPSCLADRGDMGLGNHNLILEEAGLVISQGRHEISLAESPHATCVLSFPIRRSCPAATFFIQESQPGVCPYPGPEAWTLPFQVSEVSTLQAAGGGGGFALPQLYC